MLNMECTGGRYPGSFFAAAHLPSAVTARLEVRDGRLTLRIDDETHPDRWEEFAAPLEAMLGMLEAEVCREQRSAG